MKALTGFRALKVAGNSPSFTTRVKFRSIAQRVPWWPAVVAVVIKVRRDKPAISVRQERVHAQDFLAGEVLRKQVIAERYIRWIRAGPALQPANTFLETVRANRGIAGPARFLRHIIARDLIFTATEDLTKERREF